MNIYLQNNRTAILQFIRYSCVGLMNTCVTLSVIYICKSVVGINPMLSNTIGYVLGVINSFMWNKNWVFKSHGGYAGEALRFMIGFLVCYSIQFLTVWFLAYQTALKDFEMPLFAAFTLSGYGIATLVGCCVYTVTNFTFNRIFTFK